MPVILAAAFGHEVSAVGLNQVVGNRAAFVEYESVVVDNGGLAQRVYGFEFVGREQGFGMTRVGFDLIRRADEFEQPDDAQGAGLCQYM